jgi:hypothetical protein
MEEAKDKPSRRNARAGQQWAWPYTNEAKPVEMAAAIELAVKNRFDGKY